MITLTYTLGGKPDGFSPIQPYLEVRTAYRLPSSFYALNSRLDLFKLFLCVYR